ncbi:MAG: hypothetical protein RBS39_01760 [Phycisphaerales bacterium]|jgi:DNA-directed RNA polymerase subunit RPC12/RpoP|nr:hypothetical protein [Phycisphaerales bacterium]
MPELTRDQLRKGALGALAVVFLSVAAVNTWRALHRSPVDAELDARVDYICTVCGRSWSTTMRATLHNPDLLGKCPDCNALTATRALSCPNCGKIIPRLGHGTYPPSCLHCGERFYEPEECGMDVASILQLQADAEALVRPADASSEKKGS